MVGESKTTGSNYQGYVIHTEFNVELDKIVVDFVAEQLRHEQEIKSIESQAILRLLLIILVAMTPICGLISKIIARYLWL